MENTHYHLLTDTQHKPPVLLCFGTRCIPQPFSTYYLPALLVFTCIIDAVQACMCFSRVAVVELGYPVTIVDLSVYLIFGLLNLLQLGRLARLAPTKGEELRNIRPFDYCDSKKQVVKENKRIRRYFYIRVGYNVVKLFCLGGMAYKDPHWMLISSESIVLRDAILAVLCVYECFAAYVVWSVLSQNFKKVLREKCDCHDITVNSEVFHKYADTRDEWLIHEHHEEDAHL